MENKGKVEEEKVVNPNLIKLRKPFEIERDGKKTLIKQVELDFDRLTVQDLYDVESEITSQGEVINDLAFCLKAQWKTASVASGLPVYVDALISPLDHLKLCRKAKSFLLGMD